METKGITCKIPLDLHNRISEDIRESESTMSKFIEIPMPGCQCGRGRPCGGLPVDLLRKRLRRGRHDPASAGQPCGWRSLAYFCGR